MQTMSSYEIESSLPDPSQSFGTFRRSVGTPPAALLADIPSSSSALASSFLPATTLESSLQPESFKSPDSTAPLLKSHEEQKSSPEDFVVPHYENLKVRYYRKLNFFPTFTTKELSGSNSGASSRSSSPRSSSPPDKSNLNSIPMSFYVPISASEPEDRQAPQTRRHTRKFDRDTDSPSSSSTPIEIPVQKRTDKPSGSSTKVTPVQYTVTAGAASQAASAQSVSVSVATQTSQRRSSIPATTKPDRFHSFTPFGRVHFEEDTEELESDLGTVKLTAQVELPDAEFGVFLPDLMI